MIVVQPASIAEPDGVVTACADLYATALQRAMVSMGLERDVGPDGLVASLGEFLQFTREGNPIAWAARLASD